MDRDSRACLTSNLPQERRFSGVALDQMDRLGAHDRKDQPGKARPAAEIDDHSRLGR
jgi:hypothetical protein